MWSAPSQSETSALSTSREAEQAEEAPVVEAARRRELRLVGERRSPGAPRRAACPAPGPSARARPRWRRPTCARARGGCPRTAAPRLVEQQPGRTARDAHQAGSAPYTAERGRRSPRSELAARPTIVRCRPSSSPTRGRQPSRLEVFAIFARRTASSGRSASAPISGGGAASGVADLLDHLAHGDQLAAAEIERLAFDPGRPRPGRAGPRPHRRCRSSRPAALRSRARGASPRSARGSRRAPPCCGRAAPGRRP